LSDGPLLVEQYVPGVEVAVEGLLRDGELTVLAVFDKPDPLEGPYFEETIYVTPSRLPPEALGRVAIVTARACAAIGLVEGPVHAEVRVDHERVHVVEVAARSIGGLCARTLRFGAGIALEELVLRHALGMPLDGIEREPDASGVMMLPIPAAGTLREVRGQDQARAVPGVTGLEITIPRGRTLVPLPDGDRYLGFVFARGDTPAAVEASLRAAHAALAVEIGEGEVS
jgi:biotin carboxylase